jgi:hypothetical protein
VIFWRRVTLAVSSSQDAPAPSRAMATISFQPHPNALATALYSAARPRSRRVVGVQCGQQPAGSHLWEHVVLEPLERVRAADVGRGAHRDRDPRRGHAAHQLGILHDRQAVVDAFHAEHVNAGGEGGSRRVLALVGGEAEPGGVGRLEGGTERVWRPPAQAATPDHRVDQRHPHNHHTGQPVRRSLTAYDH